MYEKCATFFWAESNIAKWTFSGKSKNLIKFYEYLSNFIPATRSSSTTAKPKHC